MLLLHNGASLQTGNPLSQTLFEPSLRRGSLSIYVTWGFTAGVFTPPSGEQDQTGRLYKFCYGRHVCEDGRFVFI